jgi:HemY protein
LLTKHRAFTPQASASLVRGLGAGCPAQPRTTPPSCWPQCGTSLDAAERATPELALAALDHRQHLLGQGVAAASPAPASASASASASADTLPLLKEALGVLWERLPTLGSDMRWRVALHVEQALPELPGDWLGRIEDSQARYPSDLVLQYLAGQAFMQRRLWGKAAALLNRCVPLLENRELARRGWCSLAQLAEERGDAEAAQAAWKRAAQS